MFENPSSPKIQEQQIKHIIAKTAKNFNFAYRQKKERTHSDLWASRQDKVWARLRKDWSADRFIEAKRQFAKGNRFQQQYFIEQVERAYDGR